MRNTETINGEIIGLDRLPNRRNGEQRLLVHILTDDGAIIKARTKPGTVEVSRLKNGQQIKGTIGWHYGRIAIEVDLIQQ